MIEKVKIEKSKLTIGNIQVKAASDVEQTRFTGLLWSGAGTGKTTLACTAPGKKLIINLDPDGPVSVAYRGDVDVLDLSSLSTDDVLHQLKSENNPLGLDAILKDTDYETVILDSATTLSQRALEYSVRNGLGKSPRFSPTMEAPGLAAYGGRNATLLTCIKGLLRVTGRHNCHCIIVSHEDSPTINDQGEVMFITLMLGGKLVNNFSLQMSEVWWIIDDGKGRPDSRKIAIRPCRQHKPMKTRIFRTDAAPEFPLLYNPEKWKEPEHNPIAKWWRAWELGKGKKLELPK